MSQALEQLAESISGRFAGQVTRVESRCGELTFEVAPAALVALCTDLRDDADWSFEQLIDICGVDYSLYGVDEWNTETATFRGFSRGVSRALPAGSLAPTLTPSLSPQALGLDRDGTSVRRARGQAGRGGQRLMRRHRAPP
jgi:hypothetical protein